VRRKGRIVGHSGFEENRARIRSAPQAAGQQLKIAREAAVLLDRRNDLGYAPITNTRQKIGAGMSSTSFRRPDFRLHLGYPEVTLLRSDVPGMVRLAPPDHPAFADDLRRLAAAVDSANGRLTVILPDREVWRDRPHLASRTPWTRRREAREVAARALGVPAGDVALSVGRRGADGATPVAATRRQTVVEVRRMLAAVGLRPEVIRGAGRFDGFSTPPALGNLRWNPAGRPLPSRLPRAAMATGGLAATIAAVVALFGATPPDPVASPGPLVHQSVAREPVTFAEAPPPAPKAARAPVSIASATPPAERPRAEPVAATPLFSVNTRNVDLTGGEDGRPVLKLHELPGARSLPVGADPAPLPRPRTAAATPAGPAPAAEPRHLRSARPLPRPLTAVEPVAAEVRRVAAIDTEDFVRPEHRPEAAAAVRVASLTPTDAILGALAAAGGTAPLARPAERAATPAPKALPPRTPAPAPKLQRAATAGAVAARPVAATVANPVTKPVIVAAVGPQPKIVPVTPTPKITRTIRAAAKPAAAAPATTRQATATPARKTVAAAAPRAGASRSQLSLIGVFGNTSARHALVRMPNGEIERVRAGDSIAGLQVAAVSSDGVRMRSGGTETMLRLPD
jgi:hypothetical protein